MDSPIQLTLTESKSKDLVPILNGKPLHSLHNPLREAEVFASNHLAQLSQRPREALYACPGSQSKTQNTSLILTPDDDATITVPSRMLQ